MLTLLMGKAGSGKTAEVMRRIRENVLEQRPDSILLVPEQYSHEAERELARTCPDSLSLYAEVLSFTGLARRLFAEYGSTNRRVLDEGGKLLSMALALDGFGKDLPGLKIFGGGASETQELLVKTVDELKASEVGPRQLREVAERIEGHLAEKLRELALIMEQYDTVVHTGGVDSADRLKELAELIRGKAAVKNWQVYADGFSDFTACEEEVLQALMAAEVQLTVCLTAGGSDTGNEIFSLAGATAARLRSFADENGIEVREEQIDGTAGEEAPGKDAAISIFAENLFLYAGKQECAETGSIRLFRCTSRYAECELAAAEARRLVKETGCRWRDIAVAVRGFRDYETVLRRVFEHYEVPLFTAEKTDLFTRPLPALIAAAYETAASRWEQEDVTAYMRTGITGLSQEECDELETYLFRWQIDERGWRRAGSWRQHPEGSGKILEERDREKLDRINRAAEKLARPLWNFINQSERAETGADHVRALTDLLRELDLPRRMAENTARMVREGHLDEAREQRKIWDLTCGVLEQCAAVLGRSRTDREEFGKLLIRVMGKYSFSRIPVSVDRVSAGDFDRMRRRNIRHLLVLGASNDRIPGVEPSSGAFSEPEREQLLEAGLTLGAGREEMWREITRIYNCLSLPSSTLTMSYASQDEKGNVLEPSLLIDQAVRMFDLPVRDADLMELRLAASAPAFSLAVNADLLDNAPAKAAEKFFLEQDRERLETVRQAARRPRGSLSPLTAEKLYGKEILLSASKADTFASCKFAYFCRYGLRARPYEAEDLRPSDVGTFMHRVFEQTAREVQKEGGFKNVDDSRILELADQYMDEYIEKELQGFAEKTARFIFLFRRLREDVHAILLDTTAELRKSEFEPLDFELDILRTEGIRPYCVQSGDRKVTLSGIVDRVDGWEHGEKLYLRVVDYKTGRKEFRLSDVLAGTNLQMLLYLNDLVKIGRTRYGKEIVPGGIMYLPARNDYCLLDSAEDPSAEKKARKAKQRSGLLQNDADMLEAWETGEEKLFLPADQKNGIWSGDSLAEPEDFNLLSGKVDQLLRDMAGSLARGEIDADPLYESAEINACRTCDYRNRCGFRDGEKGESIRKKPRLPAEKVWEQLRNEEGKEETHGKGDTHG